MSEVAERKAGKDLVEVLCAGIACKVGFALVPDGFDQGFAEFVPGVPSVMERHYADFLISQDPQKFKIVEKKMLHQDVQIENIAAKPEEAVKTKRAYNRKKK